MRLSRIGIWKMAENWIEHFVDFLKYFESESNKKQIHQFRRSFQGGNKKDRLFPQLEAIYEKAKDHFNDTPEELQTWFNHQSFRLNLGLKTIVLKSTAPPNEFQRRFFQLCSKWSPELYQVKETVQGNGMGISRKQMRMAKRRLHQLDDQQLSSVLNNVPPNSDINQNELTEVLDNRSADRISSLMNH
jgi:hypothetical protein